MKGGAAPRLNRVYDSYVGAGAWQGQQKGIAEEEIPPPKIPPPPAQPTLILIGKSLGAASDHVVKHSIRAATSTMGQVLREAPDALPPPLKGVIRIDTELLAELERNPQSPTAEKEGRVSLRVYFKPPGEGDCSKWIEVLQTDTTSGGVGNSLKAKMPNGDVKVLGEALNVLQDGFEVIVDAEGPWHLVTFFETSLMQVTAETLAQGMQLLRGWNNAKFYAEALCLLDSRLSFLEHAPGIDKSFTVYLFGGRRAPHRGFHLLQNLWVAQRCPSFGGTSSLFAFRVFRGYGFIEANGQPAHAELQRPLYLVGTHAHEGSMVFQAIAAAADEETEYPMSSLLWHMNYWLVTGNMAILPDTMGTPAFAYLLSALQFPPEFVADFNRRHGPQRTLAGGKTLLEEIQNTSVGGLIRQDSGDVASFVKEIFVPSVVLSPDLGWVIPSTQEASCKGFKCLASEISKDDDVTKVKALGYCGIGTGGYLGEKPWSAQVEPVAGESLKLTGRVDLVAKVSCVHLGDSSKEFFPVKLGDYDTPGEWHSMKPGKFALSPRLNGTGSPLEEIVWKRCQRQGEVPGCGECFAPDGHRFFNLKNYSQDKILAKSFDKDKDRQKRFEDFWQRYKYA